MRNLLFIITICFLFAQTINAQNFDQDSVIYLTAEDEAFMIDKECKFLLKLLPDISIESKISEAFSITAGFGIESNRLPSSFQEIDNLNTDYNYLTLNGEIGLRYYYAMPGLIKKGMQANNLTGKYFGISSINSFSSTTLKDSESSSKAKVNGVRFIYGNQKRFLNSGYVDFYTRLTISNVKQDITFSTGESTFRNTVFALRTGANVGFGLGKRYKISEEVKCPIFKCHTDRHSAFKIDRTKGFSLIMTKDDVINTKNRFSLSLNPSVSYERKLFNSSWSLEQELSTYFSFSTFSDQFGLNNMSLSYSLGTRFYNKMKKKILKGQSGNNLSGQYIFSRFNYDYAYNKLRIINVNNPFPVSNTNDFHNVDFQFGIGIQKMVLDNLFFDYQIGFSIDLYESTSQINRTSNFIIGDFKIGVVF